MKLDLELKSISFILTICKPNCLILQRLILLPLFIIILVNTDLAQEWKNLKPLITTRNEVRQIFKEPKFNTTKFESYETKDGTIDIWYSSGFCREKKEGVKWNVSPNLITNFTIKPPKMMSFEEALEILNLNLSSLSKSNHPTDNGKFFYNTQDQSISIQTFFHFQEKKEILSRIEIYPAKKMSKLLCKDSYPLYQ